ncbi:DR2241 family protein [Halobium salinum]|uniref:DR2241 family protein n=1 Tax=Halobium salinum TaxID=1364940 RepID=A0ABD5P7G6_9EURY|nr:DR2241 family protein [Halobium salinum]
MAELAEVDDEQFAALKSAAEEGVQFDGLYAHYGREDYDRDPDAYAFGSPAGEHTKLDAEAFREAAESAPRYVSNWYYWERVVEGHGTPRRAFLRWLEGAPSDMRDESGLGVEDRYERLAAGTSREWGQLLVRTTVGDRGHRRYEVRHVDDEGAPLDDLDVHESPLDAREVAKYDPKGRYRPLKTAPSLQRGWAFTDLDGRDLYECVDAFYPATVANWYREREGALDVTHWEETAERQTGIYDVIDELDAEAVERIAATCCVDSQCLKRRQWDHDEDDEIDVPRGDGLFPCREPCSLVVAAARKWTTLEREESHSYEFELTPSEKEQLEELVDAVADNRVDEIREADVYEGANRYRTRYLREKLFDEDGNLAGVATERE